MSPARRRELAAAFGLNGYTPQIRIQDKTAADYATARHLYGRPQEQAVVVALTGDSVESGSLVVGDYVHNAFDIQAMLDHLAATDNLRTRPVG